MTPAEAMRLVPVRPDPMWAMCNQRFYSIYGWCARERHDHDRSDHRLFSPSGWHSLPWGTPQYRPSGEPTTERRE